MMTDVERAVWLAERAGKLTASRMRDAMDFKKDKTPSQKRSDYLRDLLAERLTGMTTHHFVTPAMEWGTQQEDAAKVMYETTTGIPVRASRFYDHPTIDAFGATPDGEIDHDGLIETKCPTTGTFVGWVMAGVVPPEYKPQMIAQLACTERRYVTFVAFDPRLREVKRQLFVREFVPTAEEIAEVEDAARAFLSELDAMFDAFVTA
jgi:predicted phage-related endonuclease